MNLMCLLLLWGLLHYRKKNHSQVNKFLNKIIWIHLSICKKGGWVYADKFWIHLHFPLCWKSAFGCDSKEYFTFLMPWTGENSLLYSTCSVMVVKIQCSTFSFWTITLWNYQPDILIWGILEVNNDGDLVDLMFRIHKVIFYSSLSISSHTHSLL